MSGLLSLPEGYIAAVISFTSPREACHLACVSTTFRSVADSDVVWDRFLPHEYSSSWSSSSTTWSSLSKKELYFCTCLNLIHKGKLVISKFGKIKFRVLCLFSEVVIRGDGCLFEIGGKITTSLLSLMTTYVAYLVFAENLICWVDYDPAKVTIGLSRSNNGQNQTVYIHRERQDGDDDVFYPKKRAYGWLETELGEFFSGGDEKSELLITIKSEMKEGFIIQGIEIRPKRE
ncbi:hypothetical protein LWI29_027299 [Acer saccharum]|uniref:F-box domain-containing protein n=1 Tax=Acer saccharum TaxID=4024 RepID=A0AA39VJ61_ACESA|nr:hypothetical protein LWI29_027299 [Acer saccharum]